MNNDQLQSTEHLIMENQMRLEVHLLEEQISAQRIEIRSGNTSTAYAGRQREYIQWCRDHPLFARHPVPHLATAEKLLLYLRTQRDRPSRRPQEHGHIIGIRSIEMIVSAIVDLWKQQKAQRINTEPSPNSDSVKAFLQIIRESTAARLRTNFTDTGVGSLLDGYSTLEQLSTIISCAFNEAQYNNCKGLRNAAAFALSHALLLRGEIIF